jgi:hypothetical protein
MVAAEMDGVAVVEMSGLEIGGGDEFRMECVEGCLETR